MDRGRLLYFVWARYRELFAYVPDVVAKLEEAYALETGLP